MSIGGGVLTRADYKSSSIRAVVTRANGKVEDLGLIAYHHRNPLFNLVGNLWVRIKEAFR